MAKTSAEIAGELLNRLREDVQNVGKSLPKVSREDNRFQLIQELGVAGFVTTFIKELIAVKDDGTLGDGPENLKITPFGAIGEPELTVKINTSAIPGTPQVNVDGDVTNMYFPELRVEDQDSAIIAHYLLGLVQANIDFIIAYKNITTRSSE